MILINLPPELAAPRQEIVEAVIEVAERLDLEQYDEVIEDSGETYKINRYNDVCYAIVDAFLTRKVNEWVDANLAATAMPDLVGFQDMGCRILELIYEAKERAALAKLSLPAELYLRDEETTFFTD
jgi:hypothetical protein